MAAHDAVLLGGGGVAGAGDAGFLGRVRRSSPPGPVTEAGRSVKTQHNLIKHVKTQHNLIKQL